MPSHDAPITAFLPAHAANVEACLTSCNLRIELSLDSIATLPNIQMPVGKMHLFTSELFYPRLMATAISRLVTHLFIKIRALTIGASTPCVSSASWYCVLTRCVVASSSPQECETLVSDFFKGLPATTETL